MLKTVERSTAKKTAGCAVTYRAGKENKFDTCPADCKLNDSGRGCGPQQIDDEYLDALLDAKPRRGYSMAYSHFHPLYWGHKLRKDKTTINYSADTIAEAAAVFLNRLPPVVTVVKKSFWKNGKHATIERSDIPDQRARIVRCPAEYLDYVTCENCGGKDGPLCARLNRDFIVGFTGHGPSKNKIEKDERGGCYAAGGNVALHWKHTADQNQTKTDAEILRDFMKKINPRAVVRHHIAGDIGKL